MKILHLTKYLPTFPGGIEKVTALMARSATRAGHEVEVIGFKPSKQDELIDPPPGVRLTSIKPGLQIGSVPLSRDYMAKVRDFNDFDLIHVHLPNPVGEIATLRILSRRHDKRPLVVPVLHAPILKWGWLGTAWEKTFQKPLVQRADRVLCSSENLRQLMEDRGLPCTRKKTFILPFGIPRPPEISMPYHWEGFHIATVSRLVPYKGLETLIRAMSSLKGNWHLTIVGSGPEEPRLRRLIETLELRNRITIETNAHEMKKHAILAGCDLFVQPSQTMAETFGISIVEAFSHGKPVVTTDIPTGVAFLARGGACGSVVPSGDAARLSQAIQGLMQNSGELDSIGKRNQDFWKNELSEELYEKRYLSLVSDLQHSLQEETVSRGTAESTPQTHPLKRESLP